MYSILIVVIVIVNLILSKSIRNIDSKAEFDNYVLKYHRIYHTPEENMYRLKIFSKNMELINEHNFKQSSYQFGINQFTDLTQTEFLDRISMPKPKLYKRRIIADFDHMVSDDSIDWTTKGAVSPVKDQGACGSCYSFSVVSAIESAYFIKNNEMKLFSEQQIVDCAGTYGCQGCSGCWMVDAFAYVVDHGLCLATDYTYRAVEQKCKDTTCTAAVKMSSYVEVPPTEADLAKATSKTPISIALDATPMQLYASGIYDGDCSPTLFNHAVLVVGYGVDGVSSKKFWKIKNSWGSSWGEKGFYRLIKDDGSSTGRCGVAGVTSYPVIA